jgi:5'-nucleotidase / UDP-sugar diphosphatase
MGASPPNPLQKRRASLPARLESRAVRLPKAPFVALGVLACVVAGGSCSCEGPAASGAGSASASSSATAARPKVDIDVLYTTDEHGWLQPLTDKGRVRGGAGNVLARFLADEKHCARRPNAAAAQGGEDPCADASTILLSGGDNWTGPAISSYFEGASTAEAMNKMGYAAAVFGNHEFDFGRARFLKNRAAGGFPYVSANLVVKSDALEAEMTLPSHVVVQRRGVRIAVVGVTTETTLKQAMASRFEGIAFEPAEKALQRAIPEAWAGRPDAVVVLAHECPDKLVPMLERHPEWNIAFVGGGHCHKRSSERVRNIPVVNPGWRWHAYAKVRLSIDPSRPLGERVTAVAPEIVDVEHAEGAAPPHPPEPEVEQATARWKAEIDEVLGERIGYTSTGLEHRSKVMGRWIAEAWRQELGTDLAILNSGGLRQALPKGPITKASIYSVLPFDNRLMVCTLKGSDVLRNLKNEEAMVAGLVARGPNLYVDGAGRPLDPEHRYSVATIDFLYYGGAGFTFEEEDPSPHETGMDWRTPVIEWTRRQSCSPTSPLERLLAP